MTKELKLLEENFAKSSNIHTKRLCPHSLLSADAASGVRFAKAYRNILMDNDVLCEMFLPEEMTFLELEFPEPGASNRRFDVFFDTPCEHACGIFYGVMLINLKFWETVNLQDYRFIELLDFVEDNSQTARFVFCLSEAAKNYGKIKELLIERCNLYEIILEKMDLRTAEAFVKKELMKQGIYVQENDMFELESLLKRVMEEPLYEGEVSVKKLVEHLSFQYILAQNSEKSTIQKVYEKTGQMYIEKGKNKIGF